MAISERRGAVEAVAAVLMWAASFAAIKVISASVPFVVGVLVRFAASASMLGAVCAARGDLALPTRGEHARLAFLSAFGIVFSINIQFYAMEISDAGSANWIVAASPALIALLGRIFLRERLTRAQVAGLAISACGVLLVVGFGTDGRAAFGITSFGDVCILLSVIDWAAYQILSRRLADPSRPAHTIFWINVWAFVIQLAIALVTGADFGVFARLGASEWGALAFLGFGCSGAAYLMWYDAISAMPAGRLAGFQYLQPLFGVVFAYLIADERFTLFMAAGGALVLLGVWMVNKGRK